MPILYQHQPDEAITWRTLAFEEDGSWWASVQKCAANVAITAALVACSLSTAQATQVFSYHTDDPGTANLHVVPESDFWQNPVAPVPASLFRLLPYGFDANEIVPLAAAPLSPDEDFWQRLPLVPAANYQRLPIGAEDDTPRLFGQFDEDFWQNPVPPSVAAIYQRLPIGQEEDTPLLRGDLDEDFWTNPVPPVAAIIFQRLPIGQEDDVPKLHAQLDEDLWQNPVRPALTWWKAYVFTDFDAKLSAVIPPPSGAHYLPVFRRRRR